MAAADPLVDTLVQTVMDALDRAGAADRTRTFRMRLLPPARWALDFYAPNGSRRTLTMELTAPDGDPETEEAPLE